MTQNVDTQPLSFAPALSLRAAVATRSFPLGIAGIILAATAFFLSQLHAWPLYEDETLALFVGRDSLGSRGCFYESQAGVGPASSML